MTTVQALLNLCAALEDTVDGNINKTVDALLEIYSALGGKKSTDGIVCIPDAINLIAEVAEKPAPASDDLADLIDRSIASIEIPEGVTTIGKQAFSYCTSLASVTLPSTLTTIEKSAFDHCTSLEAIEIPSSVETIEDNAFYYCSSIEEVSIPEGITAIPNSCFYSCTSLESIEIPSTVTSMGYNVFDYDAALKSITVKATIPPTINAMTISSSLTLEHIYVPAASVDAYKEANRWSTYSSIISAIEE